VADPKILKRVKFGSLNGLVSRGDDPEGEILLDGVVIGNWRPDYQDEDTGYGNDYRVFGYSAILEVDPAALEDLNSDDYLEFELLRPGVKKSNRNVFFETAYNLSGMTGSAVSTKAALRRMIAAEVARREVETVAAWAEKASR